MYKYQSLLPTPLGFDWDEGNREKCQKHGLTVSMIEGMFRRRIDIRADPTHPTRELRYLAVGKDEDGRSAFLVFTLRSGGSGTRIRPISARYMHRKEIERYEKAPKAIANPENG